MDKIKYLLREIDKNLDLPQPVKSRIILEIAADLNDAVSAYKNQGLSEQESIKRAERLFSFDKKTLQELKAMHQSPFRRWFDQLSNQAQTKFERILLLVIVTLVFITCIYAALNTALFYQSGSFIWGTITILLCSSVIFLIKIYQIYLKKDHTLNRIRSGVSALLVLSGLSLFFCIFGYYWQLFDSADYSYTLETNLIHIITSTANQSPQVYRELIAWTLQSSLFIMLGIVITIAVAFMWFFIMIKISKIETAHAETLLLE
jgi:hypothetical protein